MYLEREAERLLKDVLDGNKVGIILGARQVGKTTLVEHVLAGQRALFLNFDVEVDKARFLAAASLAPAEALRAFGDPSVLVIDEAQRLAETSRIVKGWHDTRLPVKFLLLGSSSLDLLDQAAESLTGRNRKLALPPLLFSETLGTQTWAGANESSPGLSSVRLTDAFLLEFACGQSSPSVKSAEASARRAWYRKT